MPLEPEQEQELVRLTNAVAKAAEQWAPGRGGAGYCYEAAVALGIRLAAKFRDDEVPIRLVKEKLEVRIARAFSVDVYHVTHWLIEVGERRKPHVADPTAEQFKGTTQVLVSSREAHAVDFYALATFTRPKA